MLTHDYAETGEDESDADTIFQTCDKNKDGKVSKGKWNTIDIDKDGTITKDEWAKYIHNRSFK